jgi:hypothetical protein
MAENMAAQFGQPITDFRYAKFEFNDGRQWTIHVCWQRRVNEAWVDEEWLPRTHGTPG